MRLIGLKFQGVGPYKGEFSIDFAALTRSHMFLIDGETGAGKTTILDCITFALYGSISGNADGRTGAGDKQRLRSRFLDGTSEKTYVSLIFEEGGHYYKVYRSPEYLRLKARGEGRTSESPKANMMRVAGDYEAAFRSLTATVPQDRAGREAERYYEFFDMPGHAEAITSRVSEVSVEVIRLLGLNRSQFSKTIMLAQGQFAQFLRMKPEQRTELVKDLFSAQEYEDIQNQLNAMRQQYGRRVDDQRGSLVSVIRTNQENAARIREALESYRHDDAEPYDSVGPADAVAHDTGAAPGTEQGAVSATDDARWALNASGDVDEPAHSADEIVAQLQATADATQQAAQALLDAAQTRYESTDKDWQAAQLRNTTASAMRKAQQDLQTAQNRAAQLDDLEPGIERDARRVELAVQANPIVELIRNRAHQDALIADNNRRLELQQDELERYESREELEHRHAQALQAAGGAQAAEHELSIARAHADLVVQARQAKQAEQQAEQTMRQRQGSMDEAQRRLAQLPKEDLLTQRLEEIAAALGAQGQLSDAIDRARERLLHARRHEALLTKHDDAEARVAALERSRDDAVAAWEEAEHRLQTAGAAQYAQMLHDNEPCPVCGSRQHPDPASRPADVPSKASVDALKAQARQRAEELNEARIALAKLERDIEAEAKASGGCGVQDAETMLTEAQQALDELKPLNEERKTLRAQQERLREATGAAEQTKQAFAAAQAALALAGKEARNAAERAKDLTEHSVAQERERAERHLAEAQHQRQYARQLQQRLEQRDAIASHITELTARSAALAQQRDDITQALRAKLAASAFAGPDDARSAALSEQDIQLLRRRIDEYRQNRAAALSELERAGKELDKQQHAWEAIGNGYDPDHTAETLKVAGERRDDAMRAHNAAATLDAERERHAHELHAAAAVWQQGMTSYAPIRTMALLAMGDKNSPATNKVSLITYAVTERFRDVLDRANELLKDIRGGIYELRLGDHEGRAGGKTGLPIEVFDRRTDLATEPSTLSGGETFFVSLALALALADVIQAENGGISMDTLFIDEGFGTLSDEFLDDVMDVLRGIARTRDIGIISHVGQLKGQIAERITVERVSENAESRLTVTI
ncbi:AAA domain-containing protein [Bifidobacterium sp. DSM 109960]|uniref:Nuclease SbcCD subunit C n=1 Tax=Bifidobacterium erythrocebi TaxID=2675325 RepID=A0A7Y0HUA8_9BIFI|nr:SMC family ATPase [Bifidobacterium sp. DSM 109960]NMM95941.1 AAA domain-containing protein [Bifidobacterium sp. DSM 109960]